MNEYVIVSGEDKDELLEVITIIDPVNMHVREHSGMPGRFILCQWRSRRPSVPDRDLLMNKIWGAQLMYRKLKNLDHVVIVSDKSFTTGEILEVYGPMTEAEADKFDEGRREEGRYFLITNVNDPKSFPKQN